MNVINIAAFVTVFTLLGFSYLLDFVNRRVMYIVGSSAVILFAIPYYYLIGQSYSGFIIATILGLAVIWPFMITVQGSLFPEAFPVNVRYTGVSLVYGITAPIVGLAPFIATYLTKQYHNYLAVAIYLMVAAAISLISVVTLTKRVNNNEVENTERLDYRESNSIS